jgi:hypothetical protein
MAGGAGNDQVGGYRGATDDRDVKNVITLSLPGDQGEVDITLPEGLIMAGVFILGVLVGGGLLKLKTWVRPEATSPPLTTSPSPSSSLFSRSLEYTANPSRMAAAAEERADSPEEEENEEVNILSLFPV